MRRLLHHRLIAMMLMSTSLPVLAQASDSPSPAAAPVTVSVQSFAVTGNTLLPDDLLAAVVRPFVGMRTLDELKQAALAIQTAYREAGYGAVAAILPEQSPADGRFEIRVVEGRLSKIEIDGEQQFTEAGIRASLPALQLGQTPRVGEIDRQIRLANENPARRVGVLLQPGASAGDVQAAITVSEQPVSSWLLSLDNTGNESTGHWRVGLGYRHAALWDLDHVLAVQVQTSPRRPSDVKVASLNYRVPFYSEMIALDAYAAYSDVEGGASLPGAGSLQFAGRGRIVGARISSFLPRIDEFDQRLVVSLDSRDYLNSCAIVGLPAGGCGSAGESVSVQPLAIDYILRRGGPFSIGGSIGAVRNMRLGGSHGSVANFEAVRPGAPRDYWLLRGGASAAITYDEGWQLQMRINGQHTNDPLVPGEQFGVGGAFTVRGYEERELTGDRGAAATIEAMSPDLAAGFGLTGASLRVVGFFDAGWVGYRRQRQCQVGRDECFIASLGIGARYLVGPLQIRFDIGHALRPSNRTGQNDTAAHVALVYSF